MRPDRVGFAAVTGGYLATTTAEWVLPSLFPLLAVELDLGTGDAGLMFAVLSGSVAVGGLAGGSSGRRSRCSSFSRVRS